MSAPSTTPPANSFPVGMVALAEAELAPQLIGLAFTAALWGIVCTQTYWYWMHFPNDNSRLRRFILLLWVVDTFDVVLSYRFFYFYAIQSFGNFPSEIIRPWEFNLEYLTSSTIMLSVQLFFVSKLWSLFSHHWGRYFLLLIVGMGAVAFGAGLGQSIRGFIHPVSSFDIAKVDEVLPDVQQVTLVATDLSIMVLLSTTLLRKRTGMRRTDNMIVNLVLFAVTQGILTSLFQFLAFVTYITMPDKLIWFAFRYPGVQLYVNAALASLNTRNRIREQAFIRPYHDHQTLNTDLNQPWTARPRSTDNNLGSKLPGVHIMTTTEVLDENGIARVPMPNITHKASDRSMSNPF